MIFKAMIVASALVLTPAAVFAQSSDNRATGAVGGAAGGAAGGDQHLGVDAVRPTAGGQTMGAMPHHRTHHHHHHHHHR